MEGLLITYRIFPYDLSFEARYETKLLLRKIASHFPGLNKAKILVAPCGMKGIILVDIREAVKEFGEEDKVNMKSLIFDKFNELVNNGEINHIAKLKVLDYLIDMDLDKLVKRVEEIAPMIKGKFRITLKSRGKIKDRGEFIRKIAEPINAPVDLKNPDYIVWIEVVCDLIGIYLEKKSG